MPKGKYIRKRKDEQASQEEIDFCQSCPLPDCIVRENGLCKLLKERLKKGVNYGKSKVQKLHR